MAKPPESQPRFPARSRHVGRRRADAPVSNEGAGGTAVHMPAILRTLHADGPGGQRRSTGGEVEISSTAEGPVPADAGLPTSDAVRAGRGGQWRRYRQHSDRYTGGVLLEVDGHTEYQGYSPGNKGLDRDPPALSAGRSACGARSFGEEGARARR